MRIVFAVCAAIISGLLITASLPPYDFSLFAWVALVPLFLALLLTRPAFGLLLSVIFGLFYLPGILKWILEVPGYTFLHHIFLGLYFVPYSLVFGSVFIFISRRINAATALIAAPFVWVALEYLRSNMFFLALPWGLLAHSQYLNPLAIQISSIAGAYGLSFLIVLVNSALAALILNLVFRLISAKSAVQKLISKRQVGYLAATAGVLIVLSLSYGYVKTSRVVSGDRIKVSIVQPSIEQNKKWNPEFEKFIMQTLGELTLEASKENPDLIVWPETALPRSITENYGLYLQVKKIAGQAGSPILLGSSSRQKQPVKNISGRKYFNSAFLIHSGVARPQIQRYDKIHLLPFSEYLPLKETIPWSYIQIPEIGGYQKGSEFAVFKLPAFNFAATICWENIFPDIVRGFVANGAQFVVNITNEAWFGKSGASRQFLSMSVFRAVENGRYIVRCGNTGISCIIDSCGRITNRLKDERGQDLFVRGVLTGPVVPSSGITFYTKTGYVFVYLNLLIAVVFIIFAFLHPAARRPE